MRTLLQSASGARRHLVGRGLGPYDRGRRRPGVAVAYFLIVLTAMVSVASLGVDWARVTVVKSELRATADAAARAAAAEIANGGAAVLKAAQAVAAQNSADGMPVELVAGDVEWGTWDSQSRTFAP